MKMRNLAIRFALWLCDVLGIVAIEAKRYPAGDPIARGQRWEAFYHEEGGLADMIAALRREAFETAAELDPRDTDKIYYWATADRNLRRLEQKVRGVIINGQVAAKQAEAKGASVGAPRKSV